MFNGVLSNLELAGGLVVHAAWQAALLALLVIAGSVLLGRWLHPRWRYALWLVVFVRLAIPVLPPAPWSVFQFGYSPRETVSRPKPQPGRRSASPIPDRSVDAAASAIHEAQAKHPTSAEARARAKNQHLSEAGAIAQSIWGLPLSPLSLAALVWAAGFYFLVTRFATAALRLYVERRSWVEIRDAVALATLEECRRQMGVRKPVRIVLAAKDVGPATCGILRPCIVLPRRLYEALSPNEFRWVILHELVHIRRRDVLVDRLATFIAYLHWFHPVGWVARYFLRRERELACDALVLDRAIADEPAAYGAVILKTAQSLSRNSVATGLVGMFAFGSYSLLHRRIRMIAVHRKSTWASLAVGAAAVLTLALVGLTDAQTKKYQQDDRAAAPPQSQVNVAAGMQVIEGICLDENEKPLPKVKLELYRGRFSLEEKFELLETLEADAEGRFRFKPVSAPPGPSTGATPENGDRNGWKYMVAATRAGRASALAEAATVAKDDGAWRLTLGPSATLQGRVTDASGKPIAGAEVFINEIYRASFPDLYTAVTDADGRYAIDDLAPIDMSKAKPVDHGDGTGSVATGVYFRVRHPDFAKQQLIYTKVPDTIDVQLARAATLGGRVIDEATSKPAAGVTVFLQGVRDSETWGASHHVQTDAEGEYRVVSLREGKYNVMVHHPERAAEALDSFEVLAGKHTEAPDLVLIDDCWLEGRLVDAYTGEPVTLDEKLGRRIDVGLYGPSRPKSGAACQSAEVDDDGWFRMRVAPGLNFPYIMNPDPWSRTLRREFYERGIEVKRGEVVNLTFRILPKAAPDDPDPAPVSLPIPAPAEREAAAHIRELGGWYEIDAEKHVIEVNMVYHYTPEEVRHDNFNAYSDAGLWLVGAFPKLRRLLLKDDQATDDALAAVAPLVDLEVLAIWDANNISDAGIRHLAPLKHLKNIHIGHGHLTDESLAVFGAMPELEQLTLQGNHFTDAGVERLAGLTQLKSLWIGGGNSNYSDAAAKSISGLANLERLELGGAKLSDRGVAELGKLTNLKALYITGSDQPEEAITDTSVADLSKLTRLEDLSLQENRLTREGIAKLCALPALKRLMISSEFLTAEFREELKRNHPNLQIIVTRR